MDGDPRGLKRRVPAVTAAASRRVGEGSRAVGALC
jgi:hypothetical protein